MLPALYVVSEYYARAGVQEAAQSSQRDNSGSEESVGASGGYPMFDTGQNSCADSERTPAPYIREGRCGESQYEQEKSDRNKSDRESCCTHLEH